MSDQISIDIPNALLELIDECEPCDAPTDEAVTAALLVADITGQQAKFVNADGDGGIRLVFARQSREVRMWIDREGNRKIYWQDGKDYGLDKAENFAARMDWLQE